MPKFVEVPVYTIGELSEKAKEKAYYAWCSIAKYECSDNISTIESFCDLFSVACDAIKESWYCGSIKYAIRNALDSMFQAYQNDLEYLHSVEYFVESCEANEWTFLESGELFNV